MGATNLTPNYNLSQFVSTDKPAWLQDYNGDMAKIDAGIAAAKTAADTAQTTANSASSGVATNTNDISALQTAVGAMNDSITSMAGAINTMSSLIGNGTPTTTDQTIIGAINEINGKVTENLIDLITGLPASGNQTVTNLSGFRYIYLEVRYSSDLDSVGTLIPLKALKSGIRKTVSYYDTVNNVNHSASIRYVDDTTLALGYNLATSVYIAGKK